MCGPWRQSDAKQTVTSHHVDCRTKTAPVVLTSYIPSKNDDGVCIIVQSQLCDLRSPLRHHSGIRAH